MRVRPGLDILQSFDFFAGSAEHADAVELDEPIHCKFRPSVALFAYGYDKPLYSVAAFLYGRRVRIAGKKSCVLLGIVKVLGSRFFVEADRYRPSFSRGGVHRVHLLVLEPSGLVQWHAMKGSVKSARNERIFVGLSGGVDSAVSARLLLEGGADVVGVFIKGWYPPGLPCSYAEDRRDAMRVAARLRIPFATLDASKEYKKGVIDYLLSEYRAGRTPNPDVMCNREVKFGAFFDFAKEKGATAIATGHYARTEGGRLFRGKEDAKDQSYFLWAVPKEALAFTQFPVGKMEKSETRTLARTFNLPVALKKDSQGICFLGAVSVDDFLRAEFGSEAGPAFDEEGNELGTHDGALLSTLGARVSLHAAPQGPWYVLRKDIERNALIVGRSRSEKKPVPLMLEQTNWFRAPEPMHRYEAQVRYHGPRVEGTYDGATATFIPDTPLTEPAAPGQSLVLYENDEALGGGIIAS